MIHKILFGRKTIEVDIPQRNFLDVTESNNNMKIKNEHDIIINILNNPINSKNLSEIAKGKKTAAILASDITRHCPSKKFLPYLVKELKKGGIDIITVILGLGIHRIHTFEEKIKLVGPYTVNNSAVIDSDPERCKLIGTTSRGTPVEVFKEVLNVDLLIATGNIEYHYFAGYSGGAKAVMPGICSKNSIQSNHSLMLDDNAIAGKFYGNPVREDIEEAGKMLGIDFLFNVILDNNKKIIAAVSGNNNEAYIEGIKLYDNMYEAEIDEKVDIVITSSGGYPKDINLYQAQKALDNIKEIVKKDGEIILMAQCPEGFGEDTFENWMVDCKDFNMLSKRIRDKFVLGGHKAVAISKVLNTNKIFLYSDFNNITTTAMGFYKIDDLQSYIDYAIKRKNSLKIAVVPTGRLVKLKNL